MLQDIWFKNGSYMWKASTFCENFWSNFYSKTNYLIWKLSIISNSRSYQGCGCVLVFFFILYIIKSTNVRGRNFYCECHFKAVQTTVLNCAYMQAAPLTDFFGKCLNEAVRRAKLFTPIWYLWLDLPWVAFCQVVN